MLLRSLTSTEKRNSKGWCDEEYDRAHTNKKPIGRTRTSKGIPEGKREIQAKRREATKKSRLRRQLRVVWLLAAPTSNTLVFANIPGYNLKFLAPSRNGVLEDRQI